MKREKEKSQNKRKFYNDYISIKHNDKLPGLAIESIEKGALFRVYSQFAS
jgi:hypothetical protein